ELINGHNAGGDAAPVEEPLALAGPPPSAPAPSVSDERLLAIKEQHPRAYEKWTEQEDAELLSLHTAGAPLPQLAMRFQRQPSAIRSRLAKLAPESDGEIV